MRGSGFSLGINLNRLEPKLPPTRPFLEVSIETGFRERPKTQPEQHQDFEKGRYRRREMNESSRLCVWTTPDHAARSRSPRSKNFVTQVFASARFCAAQTPVI